MKKFVKTLLIVFLPIFCILIASYLFFLWNTRKPVQNESLSDDVLAIYKQTAIDTLNIGDVRMFVNRTTTKTIGQEAFSESVEQIISVDSVLGNTHRYRIYEEQTTEVGKLVFETSYIDGFEYFTISGVKFCSEISEDVFLGKFPATVMLSPSNYTSISAIQNGETYQLSFQDATEPEAWMRQENMQFLNASGSVILTKEGKLLSNSYKISYLQHNIKYDVCYSVSLEAASLTIEPPKDQHEYLIISDNTAVRALEQTVIHLLQANTVNAAYQEEIYFAALGDRRIRNIELNSKKSTTYDAEIITRTTTTNDIRLDWADVSTKTELFQNQTYSITVNGVTTENSMVQAEDMQLYLHNQLISTVMLPAYTNGCTVIENGSVLRFEYSGNADFIEFLCQNAGEQLYQDPHLIQVTEDSLQIEMLICHLEIDRNTGLPLSSGINFKGCYTIEEIPYDFSYSATQKYQFPTT